MRSMTRALPLLLLCTAANAAEVAQFRAEDFGAEWPATRGGAVLSAVHAATNGWDAAFAGGGGVTFVATNGVASPLAFDPATLECCHNTSDANIAPLRLRRR